MPCGLFCLRMRGVIVVARVAGLCGTSVFWVMVDPVAVFISQWIFESVKKEHVPTEITTGCRPYHNRSV
jgi:hypothetical protein